MENTLYNISQVLGITIIHSIWQGLLIYFMLRIALLFSARLTSSAKYLLAVSSLLAITGWFVYTLINEIYFYNWLAEKTQTLAVEAMAPHIFQGNNHIYDRGLRYYYSIEKYLPWITALYLAGLLFNTIRLLLDRRKIAIIRQTVSIDMALQTKVNLFTGMLNIEHRVKLGLTKLVDVPCMVGYLKPIILLPLTLSTYLGAEEIEAILLHELAHIKRNDYLVNLLQQVMTTLLFFNPCAQLINRIINDERENCCDDLVVESAPNPIVYAKALLKLEQTRENNMRMAMSATGKKYHLLNRIERIMKTKKATPSLRPTLLAMLVLTVSIGSISVLKPQIAQGEISVKSISPVIVLRATADTAHRKTIRPRNAKHIERSVKANKDGREYVDLGEQYYSGYNDPELKTISAQIGKYSDEIGKYYENPEFEKLQEQLKTKEKEIEEFYSNPVLQNLIAEQKKYGEDYAKNFTETSEIKRLSQDMEESGKKMDRYYNGYEFKKFKEETEKKYGLHNQVYNTRDTAYASARYKKFATEIYSRIPVEIRQQQEAITRLSKEMNSRYNNPVTRQMNQKLIAVSDSLKMAYDDGTIKQKQVEVGKLSAQLERYQNNEVIKLKQKRLIALSKKATDYTNSPEFKKRLEDYRKTINGKDADSAWISEKH